MTEALCAELTVKVTQLPKVLEILGVKIWEVSGPASRFRMGSGGPPPCVCGGGQRGWPLSHAVRKGMGWATGWTLCPKSEFLHGLSASPSPLEDAKDIFDFCGLLEDGRVGAAVTGTVCH